MGWAVGFDTKWDRWIGYGVPSICDHLGCDARIDRGLAYVCGGEPYGGDAGCGLYFCPKHLSYGGTPAAPSACIQRCERCATGGQPPFEPTPDTAEWTNHLLTDPSWAQWRSENPAKVAALQKAGA